jgi:hypothetical protein
MYRDRANVGHEKYDFTVATGATGMVTAGLRKNLEAIPGKYSIYSLCLEHNTECGKYCGLKLDT